VAQLRPASWQKVNSHARGKMLPTGPQPDQEAKRWVDHVLMYEVVFEQFTLQFAYSANSSPAAIRRADQLA
jgi:hypothetical protein